MGSLVAVQIYRGDLHLLDGDLAAGGIQEYVDLILVAFPLHFQHHGDAGYGKGPQPRLGIVHGHPGGHPENKAGDRIAKAAAQGHFAGEPAGTQHQGFRILPPGTAYRVDVCRQVLAVCIHGDHPLLGWEMGGDVFASRLDGPALPSVFRMPQQDRRRGKLGKYRLGRRGTAIVHHHHRIRPRKQSVYQGQELFIRFIGRYQCDHGRIPLCFTIWFPGRYRVGAGVLVSLKFSIAWENEENMKKNNFFAAFPRPAPAQAAGTGTGACCNAFFFPGKKPIYISTRRGVCPYLSQIVEASIKKAGASLDAPASLCRVVLICSGGGPERRPLPQRPGP